MSKAVIAGGHDLSCEIAMDIMKAGGNVVDASIAALVSMFITEPAMASGGGGGFACIHRKGHSPQLVDFFCQTPAFKRVQSELQIHPIQVDFGADTELFYSGNGSAAIPGTLAGIFKLHELHGSIPLKELFQPAIDLMKKGVSLNNFQQSYLKLLEHIFLYSIEGKRIFAQHQKLKNCGDIIRMQELADFLEVVAIEGKELFYKGEAGQELVKIHEHQGGMISRTDLANYNVEVRKPLTININEWTFHTVPFPFLGGVVMKLILEGLPALKNDFSHRVRQLYNIFENVIRIHKDAGALQSELRKSTLPLPKNRGSTSHFSIIDKRGEAVSLTTSIGEGSGLILPSSGMHINNMLGELALLPAGLHSWVPDVRLNSRMCPVIGGNHKGDSLVLGTGGAGRIPYVLSQFICHVLSGLPKVNLDETAQLPRIFSTPEVLHAEHPIDINELYQGDKSSKTWPGPSLFFGGVNVVGKINNHLSAAADSRRQGYVRFI